ncbi:hypothetical protein AVEN_4266-1 [Araneus ventricosus]|uniref:Uncharacterized protein n=1 Tax=Araneus ventricosus TaxID=182803 RepID=A0A4Y2SHU1_ARAVE|nr:hypothetical protein AVEN_4266-1 [Araneus ventricosus]
MLLEGSHIPALLCVPIRRSPKGSSQVSANATLRNRRSQLLDSGMSPLGTAQRLKSYSEGRRQVGTVHFEVGGTADSTMLLHSAEAPNTVVPLTYPRKILVQCACH